MKIAFFSESVADESALRILVVGILNEEIEQTNLPNRLQYRSSTQLDRDLSAVIKAVDYNSDADALVVVSDSDDSPVHTIEHEENRIEKCRLCQLRKAVADTLSVLRPVAGKDIIKVAVGVPVPAIEAWYLFGRNPQLFEATWMRQQNGEKIDYDRKKIKRRNLWHESPVIRIGNKTRSYRIRKNR
ncbi:MAG: hypothetical protein M3Q99_03980 [Acidobacteriota bacterium]|nr:hypothetical protein [Acidobacteriota bacterium]